MSHSYLKGMDLEAMVQPLIEYGQVLYVQPLADLWRIHVRLGLHTFIADGVTTVDAAREVNRMMSRLADAFSDPKELATIDGLIL